MKYSKIVETEWRTCYDALSRRDLLRSLREGGFTLDHYKAFLRETYHNT